MENSNNSTTTNQEEATQNQHKVKFSTTNEIGCSARLYKRKIQEGQEALFVRISNIDYIREEISQNIVNIVSENNDTRFRGIQTNVGEPGIERNLSTISRKVKKKKSTRNRIRQIHNVRNFEFSLNTHQNFFQMINDEPDESLIFIDESFINLHQKFHYGYAPTGMTPTLNEPTKRSQNIFMLGCHFDFWGCFILHRRRSNQREYVHQFPQNSKFSIYRAIERENYGKFQNP
ncbi:hypothetical protein RF11_12124 [Thelohanellus kitauei]|uniref:Tc1-like transposase DDE domain-containing protein n=1 Tax=Thelohanellus kitauei TaxID=669202 RepID=A0A0C2IU31_THEKT|nr:hypothetical protein RF11_12124 [Thelohanellus kitauei]